MKTISQQFSDIYEKTTILYQNNSQRDQNFSELSSNDEHYLDILYSLKKPTLTKFSEKAKISKPAATRIIQKFIEKKYLTKRPSKTDGRVQYLTLSEELEEYFKNNYQLFDQLFLGCIAVLTGEEKKQLQEILEKINRNL
ncbi:MAG: MarR family winged helix-turn-helix transcriptional regulator [Bacillus sp. (in: firmicutes)]